ncbi:hypothetical protein GCM10009609_62850 [Pseudonocardia aurantiaca]|uniref:Uncharacterized protein n=1 Tax=Pseudonocardia aurantiaca TaxID=75290 RepID=A0ABW4FS82_9PSEU
MSTGLSYVYAVHSTRPDDVGAVEIVFVDEREARRYAQDRSQDWRVPATSVTRFVVGYLGTRHPLTWFADGEEQPARKARPGKLYPVADAGSV